MKLRSTETIELIGVSRRQLQYWVKVGLGPSPATEQPQWHNFRFRDLLILKAIATMRSVGIAGQQCWGPIGDFKSLVAKTSDDDLDKMTFFFSAIGISTIWSQEEPRLWHNARLVLSVRVFKREIRRLHPRAQFI